MATASCARIEAEEKTIEFDDDDALAVERAVLTGKRVREMTTQGGGACSMHAVFGAARCPGDCVSLEHPRSYLRSVLDKPLNQILHAVRPCM